MYTIKSFKYIDNSKDKTTIFLHGWGCDYTYMEPFKQWIKSTNLLLIDLPGFGKNECLPKPFSLDDFTKCVYTFLKKNNYQISFIVGHSFGGKLSIMLASKLKIKAIFLLAPSIFNKKRNINYYLSIYLYKTLKKLHTPKKILNLFGSQDYRALNQTMKRTMSLILNENISKILESIKIPLIVFYGNKDKTTPICLYKKIKKHSFDSTLIKLNGDHFAYLSNMLLVSSIIERVQKTL